MYILFAYALIHTNTDQFAPGAAGVVIWVCNAVYWWFQSLIPVSIITSGLFLKLERGNQMQECIYALSLRYKEKKRRKRMISECLCFKGIVVTHYLSIYSIRKDNNSSQRALIWIGPFIGCGHSLKKFPFYMLCNFFLGQIKDNNTQTHLCYKDEAEVRDSK